MALTGRGPLVLTATKLTGDANVPAGESEHSPTCSLCWSVFYDVRTTQIMLVWEGQECEGRIAGVYREHARECACVLTALSGKPGCGRL